MLSRPKELLLLAFNLESALKRQAGRTPDRTSKLAMLSLSPPASSKKKKRAPTEKKESKRKGF